MNPNPPVRSPAKFLVVLAAKLVDAGFGNDVRLNTLLSSIRTDRELDTLRRYRDEIDSIRKPALNEDSFSRYLDLNEKFHSELVRLAKNEMLQWTLDRVISLPFASPSALVFARSKLPGSAEMQVIGQEQHHAIVEAIENRQGTRAESVAREHARRLSRRNLELVLTDREILSCVPGNSMIKT